MPAPERVLDQAVAEAASLPDDERAILTGEGVVLTACVSPPRAFELLRSVTFQRESVLNNMLIRMADHGCHDQLVEYLSEPSPDDPDDGRFLSYPRSDALDRPPVNETGLTGRYAIDVSAASAHEFLGVLGSELGLLVSPGRRLVPTLVVV